MIFRANDKIGWRREVCFRAVPLTAGASTDDSKVSPLPSLFLLTHRAPPLSGRQQPGKQLLHQLALVGCLFFPFEGVYIFGCDCQRAYQLNTNLRRWKISARIICLGPAQEPTIVGAYWQVLSPVMGITHKVA